MDNHNLRMRLMLEAEKEIVEGLTETERYRYFLGRMQFLKYESGKENLQQAFIRLPPCAESLAM